MDGMNAKRAEQPEPLRALPGGAASDEGDEFEAADLWDVRRAARYLSKSATWVYRESEGGRLPFRRIGRTLRFIPSELRAWVQRQPGKVA